MRVLVTGATGFVGREVCAQLQGSGATVVAATRRPVALGSGITVHVVGELGARLPWNEALGRIDVVVHLAGLAHQRTGVSAADLQRVNVDGSEALARAAVAAGVSRVVFLSSAKVLGESTSSRPFDDCSEVSPLDGYARSKLAAERAIEAATTGTSTTFTICRSTLVYGPGVKANFLSLVRAVDSGIPLPFASVRNARSMIYVGNLASALVRCCRSVAAANERFLLADEPALSTPELVRRVATAFGKQARLFRVEPRLLLSAAGVLRKRESLAKLLASFEVDSRRFRRQLEWQSPFDVDHGLERTVEWYHSADGRRLGSQAAVV